MVTLISLGFIGAGIYSGYKFINGKKTTKKDIYKIDLTLTKTLPNKKIYQVNYVHNTDKVPSAIRKQKPTIGNYVI